MFRESPIESMQPTKDSIKKKSIESKLIEMEKDVEMVAPALLDICEKIEHEKPDMVIFLDKSARIFALPMRKFLLEKLGENREAAKLLPDFNFYNDGPAKEEVKKIRNEQETPVRRPRLSDEQYEKQDEFLKKEMSFLTGKKVFIIDETFARGTGARLFMDGLDIVNETEEEGNQALIHFFSLSHADWAEKGRAEFLDECLSLAGMKPGFELTVYDNSKNFLFSKNQAFRTVDDQTFNEHGSLSESINEELRYLKEEGLKEDDEFYAAIRERNKTIFELRKIASEHIYQAMRKVDAENESAEERDSSGYAHLAA